MNPKPSFLAYDSIPFAADGSVPIADWVAFPILKKTTYNSVTSLLGTLLVAVYHCQRIYLYCMAWTWHSKTAA